MESALLGRRYRMSHTYIVLIIIYSALYFEYFPSSSIARIYMFLSDMCVFRLSMSFGPRCCMV